MHSFLVALITMLCVALALADNGDHEQHGLNNSTELQFNSTEDLFFARERQRRKERMRQRNREREKERKRERERDKALTVKPTTLLKPGEVVRLAEGYYYEG